MNSEWKAEYQEHNLKNGTSNLIADRWLLPWLVEILYFSLYFVFTVRLLH